VLEHCRDERTGKDIDGPSCWPLLGDFADVIAHKGRRPYHLCYDVARQSTEAWVMQSGILRDWPTPDHVRQVTDGWWPCWPIEVGRLAIWPWAQTFDLPLTDMVPRALAARVASIESIRGGLPFDGREEALFAARIAVDGQAVDFFGLADRQLGGVVVPDDGSSTAPVDKLVGGPFRHFVAGDRPLAPRSRVSCTIASAYEWWDQTIKGKPVFERGRKPLYPDSQAFIAAVHKLYEKADEQRWDLTSESNYSAEWIGGKLEPDVSERTLYTLLADAAFDLADLRERRI
jgi:hypothetical protein